METVGLVPMMRLAQSADLHMLADGWLTIPGDKGTTRGQKDASQLLTGLAQRADLLGPAEDGGMVFVDVDDTSSEVSRYTKQGSGDTFRSGCAVFSRSTTTGCRRCHAGGSEAPLTGN